MEKVLTEKGKWNFGIPYKNFRYIPANKEEAFDLLDNPHNHFDIGNEQTPYIISFFDSVGDSIIGGGGSIIIGLSYVDHKYGSQLFLLPWRIEARFLQNGVWSKIQVIKTNDTQ